MNTPTRWIDCVGGCGYSERVPYGLDGLVCRDCQSADVVGTE